jgi:EAL domain-containing protein (putative c-di-GMP-specific phosphodiesterase class I)
MRDEPRPIHENPFAHFALPALSLVYQPIVSLNDGSITAFEALTRIRLPLLGAIPPARFVAWAEGVGLSLHHTAWVVREACSQVAAWQSPRRPLLISVNVSARDLGRPRFIETISAALRCSGLYPANLQLEITETSLLHIDAAMKARLADLRDLGVRLAIDDFGTGFSTLKALLETPVDAVKLDRCFIQGVATSSKCREVIRAAVALAHNLGLEVVAEGVEKKEQRAFLRSAGCDSMQGYLVSPPMPLDKLSDMMAIRVHRFERISCGEAPRVSASVAS